jgi:hypothetical protein
MVRECVLEKIRAITFFVKRKAPLPKQCSSVFEKLGEVEGVFVVCMRWWWWWWGGSVGRSV